MYGLGIRQRRALLQLVIGFSGVSLLGVLAGILAGIFILWQGARFEDLKVLEDYKPALYTKVYGRNGALIDIISSEQRVVLEFDDMPKEFVNALVALEDKDFFYHIGVSPMGILSAFKDNLTNKQPRGASTLTQQLVKNITKDKRFSYARKLKEQFLAVQLESRFTKEEIFAMYANEVPFGNNQFGISAAANYYFGKSVGALNLVECATLAGIPQAPSRFNPFRNPDSCRRKRNLVLERMREEGYITRAVCEASKKLPLELVDKKQDQNLPVAGHFVDKIRQYLFDKYGEEVVRTSGWYVHTTLDMRYQQIAEQAVREGLKEIDKTLGYRRYDCPSVFVGEGDEDPALVEEYYDPSWRTPLQDGISIHGVIMSVTEDAVEVRIEDRRFHMVPDDFPWPKIRDFTEYFKVGDVPLFKVVLKASFSDPGEEELDEEAFEEDETENLEDADAGAETEAVPEEDFPFRLKLDQEPDIEGAFLAMDPNTGDILAMVGGYDYRKSKFNRAEQAKRQVGSAFKPLVFGAALEQGYTLSDILFDEPTLFGDPNIFEIDETGEVKIVNVSPTQARRMKLGLIPTPKPYEPHNYYLSYVGRVTLRNAMAQSKNIVSVKLLNSVGYDHVIEYMHQMKLRDPQFQPYPSLALGAMEMSLEEVVNVFGTLANEGVRYEPRFISLITDSKNHIIEENPAKGEQVISPQNAYLLTSALKAVISDERGTARRALRLQNYLEGNLAGKTGTTNDYTDGWFVGYTPKIAGGVWVGRDLKQTIGRGMAGSNTALPIWLKFFEAIKKDLRGGAFVLPEGLTTVPVDKYTGKKFTEDCDCDPEGQILEVFVQGTEPTELCTREEQEKLELPWYLQKRTYELDSETGAIKPAWVEINVAAQKRAMEFIRERENQHVN